MLVTLATMALKMGDITGHDIIEALEALGHKQVVTEARQQDDNCMCTKLYGIEGCPVHDRNLR